MDAPRTIKVKCATWDQVEAFYTQKVKGNVFVLRMPQPPAVGQKVTVALVLPNGLVFAMDAEISKVGAADAAGKAAVAMILHGLTGEARVRLVRLVDEGRRGSSPNLALELEGLVAAAAAAPGATPVPMPSDAPVSEPVEPPAEPEAALVEKAERPVFDELMKLRERHEGEAAHVVLDAGEDASAAELHTAYLRLAKRYHPDALGRYRSAPIRQLASEVFLHINKAYDRLRQARAELGDTVPGPARRPQLGWFAEIRALVEEPSARLPAGPTDELTFESAVPTPLATADLMRVEDADTPMPTPAEVERERFLPKREAQTPAPAPALPAGEVETAAREALAKGRWDEAREKFAEALRAEPRNRTLRALYHVASGMESRARGKDTEAQIHFETALRHDRDCVEAQRALQRTPDPEKKGIFSKLWGR